jgi:acyl-CoA synthetase (AMP-forming)/AMP-acid ligase II
VGRSFNLADLFEIVADAIPERDVLVTSERRLTYETLDARANQLAHHLAAQGVGERDHVGLQLTNGTEYLEGMLACFKLRAVPVNVNFRYVEGELRYLFDDADLVGLVFHRAFAGKVAAVLPEVPRLTTLLVVDDDSGEATTVAGEVRYEDALAAQPADRSGFPERSADDLYIVYTGGTTGMPKGVLWRQEDIFFAAMGGGDPFQMGDWIKTPEQIGERVAASTGMAALPTPPFMHASAHWLAFHTMFTGGKIVIPPGGRFDPPTVWHLVSSEAVNTVVVVGDAMARPLADEFAAKRDQYDASSVFAIGSGGAILSSSTKAQLAELFPNVLVVDGFGSSETGTLGNAAAGASGPRFTVNDQTAVLDDDGNPVEPGSATVGRLARRGHIPLGYYGDEEKTARTFIEYQGVRWVLPGDMATVEDDGTVALLGRGSVSINSGGEKIFPEEVEAACKSNPKVFDCVVVGVPDERWGERVTAVVQPREDTTVDLADLQETCRGQIAGYKVPRGIVSVDQIVRSPAGKADYGWAKAYAAENA